MKVVVELAKDFESLTQTPRGEVLSYISYTGTYHPSCRVWHGFSSVRSLKGLKFKEFRRFFYKEGLRITHFAKEN